jgi:hypothetical protein
MNIFCRMGLHRSHVLEYKWEEGQYEFWRTIRFIKCESCGRTSKQLGSIKYTEHEKKEFDEPGEYTFQHISTGDY